MVGRAILVCDEGQITEEGNANNPSGQQRYQQHTALRPVLSGSYSHRFWFGRGLSFANDAQADSVFDC